LLIEQGLNPCLYDLVGPFGTGVCTRVVLRGTILNLQTLNPLNHLLKYLCVIAPHRVIISDDFGNDAVFDFSKSWMCTKCSDPSLDFECGIGFPVEREQLEDASSLIGDNDEVLAARLPQSDA
jgi:hypothetical protein